MFKDTTPLWRDIPCDLTFVERCIINTKWQTSTYDWLVPKCHKVGFQCKAHKLNKKLEFPRKYLGQVYNRHLEFYFDKFPQLSDGATGGMLCIVDKN